MSTKINVRSPFYLHLIEPSPPLPNFDCTVAGLTGFAVDDQGIITMPTPNVGVIDSISSDDTDFANNKFPSETTATSRTIKINLLIPVGYANSSDIFFECPVTTTQPALITSQPTPADPPVTCTITVTPSGTIPAQSIAVGGAAVSIDLATYFSNETTYDAANINPIIVTAAISGSVLTLSPNVTAGTTTVYALAYDGSYPSTCEATQAISVTITDTTQAFTCSYPSNPALQGGSITQAGVITKPTSIGSVGTIRSSAGGTVITSVAANNTANEISHTLFFDITVPPNYSNAGATVECSATLIQKGTSLSTFTCDIANLTGQSISRNGAIFSGTSELGTVKTPASSTPFPEVNVDTSRTVNFPVTIPNGYANAGSDIVGGCDVTLIQPATINICGLNQFYISTPKSTLLGHCDATYGATKLVTSTAVNLQSLQNSQICENGNAFDGKGLYYGVFTAYVVSSIGAGVGSYYIIQIDSSGIVTDQAIAACDTAAGGTSVIV